MTSSAALRQAWNALRGFPQVNIPPSSSLELHYSCSDRLLTFDPAPGRHGNWRGARNVPVCSLTQMALLSTSDERLVATKCSFWVVSAVGPTAAAQFVALFWVVSTVGPTAAAQFVAFLHKRGLHISQLHENYVGGPPRKPWSGYRFISYGILRVHVDTKHGFLQVFAVSLCYHDSAILSPITLTRQHITKSELHL